MTPFMRKYAGGGVVQMQSGRRIMRPDITADGYVPANTSYLEEIERRRLEEEAARQFPNALIEDSDSANFYSATSGDPTADGYVDPISIDLARQVSNYASDDNVIDYTRSESPQYRPPNSNLNPDGTTKEVFAIASASEADGISEEVPMVERSIRGGSINAPANIYELEYMEGTPEYDKRVRARDEALLKSGQIGDFFSNLGFSNREASGKTFGDLLGVPTPSSLSDDDLSRALEGYASVEDSDTVADPTVKKEWVSSDATKHWSKLSTDRVNAMLEEQERLNGVKPKLEDIKTIPKVKGPINPEIKKKEPEVENEEPTAIESQASGLGSLFNLEGDKKQAFSMALMALGAGIAKGDTAGGLKDAGLAMNAISEQNLDREDKQLDREIQRKYYADKLNDSRLARDATLKSRAQSESQKMLAAWYKTTEGMKSISDPSIATAKEIEFYELALRRLTQGSTGSDMERGGNLAESLNEDPLGLRKT